MISDSTLFTRRYVNLRRPDHSEALAGRLAADGLATFDGIDDPAALLTLASRLGEVVTHRDSDPDGITTVTDTAAGAPPRPGYRAFSHLALFPHTDGTTQPRPPALLWLACAVAACDANSSCQWKRTVLVSACEQLMSAPLRAPQRTAS